MIVSCHIFYPDGETRRLDVGIGNVRRIYVGAPPDVAPSDVAPSALCVEDTLGNTQVYIGTAYMVVTMKRENDD